MPGTRRKIARDPVACTSSAGLQSITEQADADSNRILPPAPRLVQPVLSVMPPRYVSGISSPTPRGNDRRKSYRWRNRVRFHERSRPTTRCAQATPLVSVSLATSPGSNDRVGILLSLWISLVKPWLCPPQPAVGMDAHVLTKVEINALGSDDCREACTSEWSRGSLWNRSGGRNRDSHCANGQHSTVAGRVAAWHCGPWENGN